MIGAERRSPGMVVSALPAVPSVLREEDTMPWSSAPGLVVSSSVAPKQSRYTSHLALLCAVRRMVWPSLGGPYAVLKVSISSPVLPDVEEADIILMYVEEG